MKDLREQTKMRMRNLVKRRSVELPSNLEIEAAVQEVEKLWSVPDHNVPPVL